MKLYNKIDRLNAKKALWGAQTEWHRHFAWWPVTLGGGDVVWLHHVQRRRTTVRDTVTKTKLPTNSFEYREAANW